MTDDHHGCVTVSVVSHLQGGLVANLLADLANFPEVSKVVLIYNLPEPTILIPEERYGRVEVIKNSSPRGFGANHNLAFTHCQTPFFCIVNPDIRLPSNPFPVLLEQFSNERVGLCAPAVVSPEGGLEDSTRRFPTPSGILLKLLGVADGRYRYSLNSLPFSPDWVGGMFMLFRSCCFERLGGFDEGFFLYYEDVDLCVRLRKVGFAIYLVPGAKVVHAARRTSHRNFIYLRWHLKSMLRYFRKHWGRLPASGV